MIIGHAIKQENFRPLNKESDGVKKAAFNAAFFIQLIMMGIYLISIIF